MKRGSRSPPLSGYYLPVLFKPDRGKCRKHLGRESLRAGRTIPWSAPTSYMRPSPTPPASKRRAAEAVLRYGASCCGKPLREWHAPTIHEVSSSTPSAKWRRTSRGALSSRPASPTTLGSIPSSSCSAATTSPIVDRGSHACLMERHPLTFRNLRRHFRKYTSTTEPRGSRE